MDEEILRDNIEIVTDKEFDDTKKAINTWKIELDKSKKKILVYPHSETLVDIFAEIQQNENLKKFFIVALQDDIKNIPDQVREVWTPYGTEYRNFGSAHLSFFTLIRLGFVDEALDALSERELDSSYFLCIIYYKKSIHTSIKFNLELY